MKSLLPPALAVLFSTTGTAFGCYAVGQPLPEVKMAAALAFGVSAITAFGAARLAGRRRHAHRPTLN